MSDPYNFIVRNNFSKNIIKKILIERELNKLFLSKDIDTIIKVGLIIDDKDCNYQKRLISLNNAFYIYRYAKEVKSSNIELLENAIIDLNDLEYIYLFAKDIENADINKLESIIIKSNNIDYLIKFYNNIKNCNTKLIEDTIVNYRKIDKLIKFAIKCRNINLNRIQKIVLEYGKSEDIVNFCNYVKGIDIKYIEDEIIKRKDYRTIYKIAATINNSDKYKLEETIINSNNAKYIYRFATYVKGANIEKLEEAIIKTNNLKYLYKFMLIDNCNKNNILKRILELDEYTIYEKMDKIIEIINNIPNIDLQLIEDYIVNSNSSKCIYEYCLNGRYLNIKSLEDKILDLNQLAFICLFAIKIKNANIIRIEEYIRNNCKIEYIKEIVEFYEIMVNIGLIDISKYEDTIIKLNNPRYMYDLARKYKNCNLLKIEAAIIKSNDSEYR